MSKSSAKTPKLISVKGRKNKFFNVKWMVTCYFVKSACQHSIDHVRAHKIKLHLAPAKSKLAKNM